MTRMMIDHPAWQKSDESWHRLVNVGGSLWLLPGDNTPQFVEGRPGVAPQADSFTLPQDTALPPDLRRILAALGTVRRYRSTDLWESIATAILRQVIRADQARLRHARLRTTCGPTITVGQEVIGLLPDAAHMLHLGHQLDEIGLAFHRPKLHVAARAYLEHGVDWAQLSAADLYQALLSIPGIGPWTAGAAVADFHHDWSLYPYSDLAVRTWAKKAAPHLAWPDKERSFATAWAEMTGPHLSVVTVLTLALGGLYGSAIGPHDRGGKN